MSNSTVYENIGPLMRIHRGAPFPIYGVRFRTATRAVLDLTGKTVSVRIGKVGAARVIEAELEEDATAPLDPFYHKTIPAADTAVAVDTYEYTYADSDGRVLLSGPAVVVDHTRPAA